MKIEYFKGITIGLALVLGLGFVAEAQNEAVKTVVIDAGHGGHDAGNLGTGRYKKTEKDISLDVALKLGDYIKEAYPDVKVVYTRKDDRFIQLGERAAIANRNKADLFISVHCNAAKATQAAGTETWVMGLHVSKANLDVAMRENSVILMEDNYQSTYADFNPRDPDSYIAMSLMQSAYLDQSLNLATKIQDDFTRKVGRHNRGIKQAGFLVLYKTSMPAILIELGFLTNSAEEDFLQSSEGKVYMASSIFRAFKTYKESREGTEGTKAKADVGKAKPDKEKAEKKKESAKATEEAFNKVAAPANEERQAPNRGATSHSDGATPLAKEKGQLEEVSGNSADAFAKAMEEDKSTSVKAPTEDGPERAIGNRPYNQKSTSAKASVDKKESIKIGRQDVGKQVVKELPSIEVIGEPKGSEILFKVQFITSPQKIAKNSPRLKGLPEVERTKAGKQYKYYSGSFTRYKEAKVRLDEVKKKFPSAFVTASRNGEAIPVQEAIKLLETSKQ